MYTIDCEDSNCVKCRQASEGQNSEEENQNSLMTVQELVSKDLRFASYEKALCLDSCSTVKDQIHCRISDLIAVLRERERELCAQVDQECCAQMTKIDRDTTVRCIDKLLKRNSEPETAPCRTSLFFTCDYHLISSELQKFGRVSYENPAVQFYETIQKELENNARRLQAGNTAPSTTPLVKPFETPSLDGFQEELERIIREANEMIHFTNEDDLEIISRSEAAAVASELPALPPKSQFGFGKEPSCFPPLYSKKPLLSRENSSASQRPICSETESKECVTASARLGMCDVEESPSFKGPLSQESSSKCLANSESSIILEAERKKLPSYKGPSSQESSSDCLGDSNAEGQGRDPSIALLSSFTKYLEKNRGGEWLVSEKSSGNSRIFNRHNPILVDNLDRWLSTKAKQEAVSDWLYTARV